MSLLQMHDWLLRPLPIDEAESAFLQRRSFRLAECKMKELRSMVLADPKAQLWSPAETWTTFPRRGMEGYAVVKDGKIIDLVLTALS